MGLTAQGVYRHMRVQTFSAEVKTQLSNCCFQGHEQPPTLHYLML